jgi:hypothetical protein
MHKYWTPTGTCIKFGFVSYMGKGESPFMQTAKSQMFILFIINIHANIFSSDNWLVVRS